MTWYDKYISKTLPRYRFKLTSPDGDLVLNNSPLEWKEGTLELERRILEGGVFVNYIQDGLTFIKEGYNFLKNLKDAYGINAECDLIVSEFDKETREYVDFPVSFSFIFGTWDGVLVGETELQIAVNIQVSNNTNLVKFDNRKKIEVDLTKTTSIGEYSIVDYPRTSSDSNPLGYNILRKNIKYPEVNIVNIYRSLNFTVSELPRLPGYVTLTSIPLEITLSDFSEASVVPYLTQKTLLNQIPAFFDTALFAYNNIDIQYSLTANVIDKHSSDPWKIYLYEVNAASVIVESYLLGSFGTSKGIFLFASTITISITKGNSLKLVVEVQDDPDIEADIRTPFIEIRQNIASSPAKTVESFPKYEFMERLMQHILDSQFPFYSEKYGRLEVIYNPSGDKYLSEDQTQFANLQSGLNIRGSSIDDTNTPMTITFDKAFDSFNAMDNIGYGFEIIDGFYRLRIEDYAYFFNDEVILDLSGRISDLDIREEALPELAYVKTESGYKKFEYEEINGRGEFNTENIRTSINKTDTVFKNISDIRADTKKINDLLSKSVEVSGTTDEKGDNDIFITKTQPDGEDWKPEFEENITIEDNSSIFGGSTLNLYYTPTRNLIRHGNKLKSSLIKALNSKLQFQSSDKLQTLRTTGEGYTISENEDILIDNLESPIYEIFAKTIRTKLTFSERNLIINNPYKRIIFTENISGWVTKFIQKNAEDEVTISILPKHVN